MVDPTTGIDLEKAGIADIVNRQNVGASQRARNELIRQQTQSGKSPDLSSLYSTQQVNQSEFPNYAPTSLPELSKDVFGNVVQKSYEYSPGFSKDDPSIQALNSKYKYNMPDLQPTAYIEGGPGYDFTKNPYGSWDLGNEFVLAPKLNRSTDPLGVHQQKEDYGNPEYYKPFKDDGTFDQSGWEIRSTKSGALGSLLSTLQILAAATGPSMFGPAGGTAGTLGSENMFFGGLNAMAPTATQTAGMFGNQAWDLGNKYVNKAAEGALKGFLFSGGNPTAALQGGLTGPVGGYLSDVASPYIGNIASKALGGAASGSLASLFTKNSPIAGSLYGGMSGGLNAYLNSVNANTDPFNKMASNTVSGLIRKKLFRNK
jgi:hypothetical protein